MAIQRHDVRGILFFDIETEGDEEMIEGFAPEIKVTAPKNWKDEEKIARYIEETSQTRHEDFVAKTPVDLDFARITSIGVALGGSDPWALMVGDEYGPDASGPLRSEKYRTVTEYDLLVWFWDQARRANRLAGYNIIGFDIPIIQRRSFKYGIEPSFGLIDVKPWDKKILDFMRLFYHNGYGPGIKYRGLKQIVKMFGIETPWDVKGHGSEVGEMSPSELRLYTMSDVAKTRELAVRMKGIYW